MSTRADQIAGFRKIADLLEQHPELPMPSAVHSGLTLQFLHDGDQSATKMAHARALIGGTFRKDSYGGPNQDEYLELEGHIEGLKVNLVTYRDNVCERVVIGTEVVTEEVPDPELVDALPKVLLERVVEQVEWRCAPVLAEVTA